MCSLPSRTWVTNAGWARLLIFIRNLSMNQILHWISHKLRIAHHKYSRKISIQKLPVAFAKHWVYPTLKPQISVKQTRSNKLYKHTTIQTRMGEKSDLFIGIHETDTHISAITFRRSFHGCRWRRWTRTTQGKDDRRIFVKQIWKRREFGKFVMVI